MQIWAQRQPWFVAALFLPAILLVVALVAVLVPARRAATADPMATLREV